MKNLAILMMLLAALTPLIACSPDRVEEEEVTESTFTLSEPTMPKIQPDEILIEVGRFQSPAELQHALEIRRLWVGDRVISALNDPEFPMSQKPKTIVVKIVTMLEVGLDKPSTLKEVIDHFSKNGYRPLTLEEAVELRIQYLNQPEEISSDKMSAFFALLKKEDAYFIGFKFRDGRIAEIFGYFYQTIFQNIIGSGWKEGVEKFKFDPKNSPSFHIGITRMISGGTRFACVKKK